MKKHNKGFTLIEILIATALMSGLAMGMMTIYQNSFKQESKLFVKQESRALFDELALTFINGPTCGVFDITKVGSLDPKSLAEIEIKDGLVGSQGKLINQKSSYKYGRLLLSANAPIAFGPLNNLDHMADLNGTVSELLAKEVGSYIQISASDNYTAELRVKMKKPVSADSKQGDMILRFPVVLTIDSANGNKITNCRSIPEIKHAQEACNAIASVSATGTWDPDTFQCELDIANQDSASNTGGLCPTDNDCTNNGKAANYYKTSVVIK